MMMYTNLFMTMSLMSGRVADVNHTMYKHSLHLMCISWQVVMISSSFAFGSLLGNLLSISFHGEILVMRSQQQAPLPSFDFIHFGGMVTIFFSVKNTQTLYQH